MQAIDLGVGHHNWVSGPGLTAEYELKKREQEKALAGAEGSLFHLLFAADLQLKTCLLCFLEPIRLRLAGLSVREVDSAV